MEEFFKTNGLPEMGIRTPEGLVLNMARWKVPIGEIISQYRPDVACYDSDLESSEVEG